jgi:hypothetical protein
MKRTRALAAVLSLAAVSCASTPVWRGLDTSSGQNLVITPRADGPYDLTGWYRSPQLGELRLQQAGARVRGEFATAMGGTRLVVGVLEGDLDGNLLRFSWRERGPTRRVSQAHGHGYLLAQPINADTTRAPQLYGGRDYTIVAPQPAHLPQEGTRIGEPLTAVRVSDRAE